MAYMDRGALVDIEEAERFIDGVHDGFLQGTLFQWGIDLRGRLIGTVTLHSIDTDHRRAEIGFVLVEELWGRGLMTEALGLVLDHAVDVMNLHRLEADVDPRNLASLALLTKLGFEREGHLRQRYFVNSEIQDAIILGLLADDWRSIR
jgi:RimJ/RimL family protein N-acetyltransferase